MESIPAGPKQGREETPVLNLECSDMWETCSPFMGDSHGGKKKKERGRDPGPGQSGNKQYTKEHTDSFSPELATSVCHCQFRVSN